MGTPYATIYNRFLLKITDYSLTELPDAVVDVMMHGYLMSAIAGISVRELREHVSEYDDSQEAFVYDLTNLEQEILALGMVESWVEPMIYSITLTQQMIGTKQTNHFSQSSHLNALVSLQDNVRKKKNKLISEYKAFHNSYLGTEEKAVKPEEP